jgi:hypothetical protein
MKTKFTLNTNGSVTVESDNLFSGERDERTYFCPANGGYVRQNVGRNGNHAQVCEKLNHTGSTLSCSASGAPLLTLIRREYNARRRADLRILAAI